MQPLIFEELTWKEIERLDRENTIVFLPVGPLEEHGPHLPVGTDIFGAKDIACMAAELVGQKAPELRTVLMPAIPAGCCGVTADFPGTVSLRGKTMYSLLADILTSLAQQGFLYLVVSNHHLDPVHMKALLTAIEEVEDTYPIIILETGSRIVYSGLELEQIERGAAMGLAMEKEVHGDVKETSYVLHRYPHLVKGGCSELPPSPFDVAEGFRKGLGTFKQMGAALGYVGTPGKASAEYGKLYVEECAGILAELTLRLYRGEALPEISDEMRLVLRNSIALD